MQWTSALASRCSRRSVITLASALAACSPPPPAPPVAESSVTPASASAPVLADSGPVANLRGYYEARDGGLFTMCSEDARRRVTRIGDADARQLATATAGSTEARFVAARGRTVGSDAVEIDAIEITAGAAWNCESRFDDFFYAARGTEQPWSLEVTSASITLTDEPGAPPLVLAYRPFEAITDGLAYRADDPAVAVRIVLEARSCAEALTDTVFALTARVDVGGRLYTGCAWRGEPER